MRTLLLVIAYFAVACTNAPKQVALSGVERSYDSLPFWTSLKQEMLEDKSFGRATAEDDSTDTTDYILLADETTFSLSEYDGQMSVQSYSDSLASMIELQLKMMKADYTHYFTEPDSAHVFMWSYPQFIPYIEPPRMNVFIHHCDWMGCKLEGQAIFTSTYEEGSDMWYFMLNHFTHPEWSEDECEDHIWE